VPRDEDVGVKYRRSPSVHGIKLASRSEQRQ